MHEYLKGGKPVFLKEAAASLSFWPPALELSSCAPSLIMRSMFALDAVSKNILLLLSVPGLYCLLVLAGRQLKRKQGVRLGWPYHLFALPLAVFVPMWLLDISWHRTEFAATTIIFGSVFVIALVDRFVWQAYLRERHKIEVPKFLTEVAGLIILFLAAFVVLFWLYRQNVEKLLIAPGILAIVIGLAMQDLIGNIIAGLALQAGKPFAHGEWLQVDGRFAQVIEINWRATRLLTNDGVSIEIPHREMAGKTIVNLNRPTKLHAMRLSVGIDYAAPPTRVKDVLLHATANAIGIAPEPRPKVYLKSFGDSSIEYEIKFWIDDQSQYFEVCDSIRTNIWYSLRRHGITIPFPIRTVQLERPARKQGTRSAKRRPHHPAPATALQGALRRAARCAAAARTRGAFWPRREIDRTGRRGPVHVHPGRGRGQGGGRAQRLPGARGLAPVGRLLWRDVAPHRRKAQRDRDCGPGLRSGRDRQANPGAESEGESRTAPQTERTAGAAADGK